MLKLKPDPTFFAKVSIPVPGAKPASVKFQFRHKTKDEAEKWRQSVDGRDDVELILDIACGWDLAEAFDEENVGFLVQNYIGAGIAVVRTYLEELAGARLGN
jgi:hypothetical protein